MRIRPIGTEEIATFAAAATRPEHAEDVREYVARMIAAGAMRPAWCFLAEDATGPIARVGYWTLPRTAVPLDAVLLDVPWDEPGLVAGVTLLRESLDQVRRAGAETIEHVCDDPPMAPQWQHEPARRAALLEMAGFAKRRETRRFAWDPSGERPPPRPERLVYRSLAEVGEDAFVAAMAEVSAESRDQRVRQDREDAGPEGEARATFADLRMMDHEPGWWELARTPDGQLAGLVMPAKSPTFATIGYVGVAPAHRGRGFVDDLLARGMATLQRAGERVFRADTDVANSPMANAFFRAGWHEFATRREYAHDPPSAKTRAAAG